MASQEARRRDVTLSDKGVLVDALWHAVDDVTGNLANVPGLVRRVLETEAWRKRSHRGRLFEHARFLDFITSKPLAGCGWPPEKVEALIRDDAETLTLWRSATQIGAGARTDLHNNVMTVERQEGNSRSYTLSRLKRESPALFEKVVAGKLSANAAAIEAGFRKKPTPFEQIQRLIPRLTASEMGRLKRLLEELAT